MILNIILVFLNNIRQKSILKSIIIYIISLYITDTLLKNLHFYNIN